MCRGTTILAAAAMILAVSGIAYAAEITATGDKITMTDVYKNNGSMRKVDVGGAEYWVPTPSSSENKLKKAAGRVRCTVTLEVTQNDEISRVDVRCNKRVRPVRPGLYLPYD